MTETDIKINRGLRGVYVERSGVGHIDGEAGVQCIERQASNILIRPLTLYNGPATRDCVPVEAR